ncbi:MAG: peptide transporter, partial [Mesorhizobium sp.]
MFVSFFPQPKLFFTSAVAWSLLLVLLWFFGGEHLGTMLGMPPVDPQAAPVISPIRFLTPAFLWFYGYFFAGMGVFYLF